MLGYIASLRRLNINCENTVGEKEKGRKAQSYNAVTGPKVYPCRYINIV